MNQFKSSHVKCKLSLLLTVTAAFLYISCGQSTNENENAGSDSSTAVPVIQQSEKKTGRQKLAGNWERTDAAYQLNISELTESGTMKAEYLNPGSIHVAKAMWAQTGEALTIYVELRDKNYPGSYYKLTYFPGNDQLSGKYFQAVESITYDVAFARKK